MLLLHAFCHEHLFQGQVGVELLKVGHGGLVIVGFHVAKLRSALACLCQHGLDLHDVLYGLLCLLVVAAELEHVGNKGFVSFAYGCCGFVCVGIVFFLSESNAALVDAENVL